MLQINKQYTTNIDPALTGGIFLYKTFAINVNKQIKELSYIESPGSCLKRKTKIKFTKHHATFTYFLIVSIKSYTSNGLAIKSFASNSWYVSFMPGVDR